MIRIVATPIAAQDLKPGDLFSTAGPGYWNSIAITPSIGEKVYIRTNAPSENAPDSDAQVFKIHILPILTSVERAAYLVHRLHAGVDDCTRGVGLVGGHMHIVVSDGNVETHDVESCLREARAEKCGSCIALGELLLSMDEGQRTAVYGISQ